MPRNICCNPFGIHRSQVTKWLRPVTEEMLASKSVKLGELICRNCRKTLTTRPKPKDLASTSESTDVGSSEVVPEEAVPSTSGTQSGADSLTSEVSMDESVVGDLSADESSADESTATESASELDEEAVAPMLNEILPNLGESPVKRSKQQKRNDSVIHLLHFLYICINLNVSFFLQRVSRIRRRRRK